MSIDNDLIHDFGDLSIEEQMEMQEIWISGMRKTLATHGCVRTKTCGVATPCLTRSKKTNCPGSKELRSIYAYLC